jgi:hypothetical protein
MSDGNQSSRQQRTVSLESKADSQVCRTLIETALKLLKTDAEHWMFWNKALLKLSKGGQRTAEIELLAKY